MSEELPSNAIANLTLTLRRLELLRQLILARLVPQGAWLRITPSLTFNPICRSATLFKKK